MLTYREALQRVLDSAAALPAQRVRLDDALGLVAAEDVVAADPVPPFTNSGMDGFAVRAADVEAAREDAPVRLRVLADLPAGRVAGSEVAPGTALRIMTGAPLPAGADAVVPVEGAAAAVGQPSAADQWVEVKKPVRRGVNIRLAGEDIAAGARVVAKAAVLRPADIGVLAEVGCAEVSAIPRPRIAVVTTGDELVEASERPGPGRIRDANIHAVCAQATVFGAVPMRFPRVPDDREEMKRALRAAAAADVIVSTGGVSMGEYDFVKDVLEELGAERLFWRVAQKPGGPLGYWRLEGKPVFGIPGNPVAAMVVMEEYVRPLLRKMMGLSLLFRPERHGTLASPWAKSGADGRLHFLRVHVRVEGGTLRADLAGPQGSGILSSMARSNALALIPEDAAAIAPGDRLLIHLTDEPEDH
jgi:molybdopterin molybdotransferase